MTDGSRSEALDAPAPHALVRAARFEGDALYTPAERRADAVVHVVGVALALMSAPALVVAAAFLDGSAAVVAAVAVYGLCMVGMFLASGAYNLARAPRLREALRRVDHAAIYLKIAATQTPFAVLAGSGHGAWVIVSVWIGALGGAASKLALGDRLPRVSLAFYLLLGWAGCAILWPGDGHAVAGATAALMVLGGLLYSVGVVFHVWERLPYQNAVWHGFVLVASFAFYGAVATELSLRAAAG